MTMIDIIDRDWKLFANTKCARSIIGEVLDTTNYGFGLDDHVSYTNDILDNVSVWEQLKKDVKENYRYLFDHEKFDVCADLSPSYSLNAGAVLYRARVTPEGQKKLRCKEMGCPPKEKAVAGRANPFGIPYLYLCKKEKTTYYEIRAGFLDKLSIGKFKIKKDLNIVDFNSKISLFYSFEEGGSLPDIVAKNKIFDAISSDLSKPLCRYDTELEYIPTQLICEYCKLNKADGICFSSSLHKGGVNFVLFDPDDATCTSVICREIKTIDIDIEK
ncbi:MAG: RES family NAD+ phosphorylase [Bacteroidales bacterium]|nr:RES family NAD+ phosphorylase [Bacteroidales bacterium]MCI2121197.1 RES family NAD+ phosphorylase [Bacteroidales bacterium]MCI2145015.1 RES family NAD+ phosphorylase [Bacteroidales bacterium]